ncbi:glycosyltransferase family 4 protein [Geodermatophilus sp. SYSU D01036]
MTPPLHVLIALDYYAPYVSGLTNVARDVAEGLAARGHRVRVVASRHDRSLPVSEVLGGVEVERAPVAVRLGKGVVAPSLVSRVRRAARTASVTNLHLPMPEAALLAGRLASPVVSTYHCDVSLPPGAVNRVQTAVVDTAGRRALTRSDAVVVTSDDYARSSRLWPAMAGRTTVIPPPCHARPPGRPRFRETAGPHVGFLGRIVEEKGLEYLVRAFRALQDPEARLLIGGGFADVAGGSVVSRVRAAIGDDTRVRLLGFVPDEDLADLYASLDVFVLPSVNAFEAFGIVQVEAMLAGVPVLASDLPGVRVPVQETGFGTLVAPRDVPGITTGLRRLTADPPDPVRGREQARARYSVPAVLDAHEQLFARLAAGGRPGG